MTIVDMNTSVYYDTAAKVNGAATAWFAAIDAQWPSLTLGAKMCGSYEEARKFATSYDELAADALSLASRVAITAHNYTLIMLTLGYNHAKAEWEAAGKPGSEPAPPTIPPSPVFLCRVPLPSAGGPGNGLVSTGVELAEMLKITVPDGDTTKMSNAAAVWDRIETDAAVTALPDVLEAAANAFEAVTAPESSAIDEDLRALRSAAAANIAIFGDLATACREHRASLDDLRATLKTQLESIRDALMIEPAINAAISIASSWITFGVSAAVGVAGAAAICARYARPMRASIEAWQAGSPATRAVRTEQVVAHHTPNLNRLDELKATMKPEIKLEPVRHPPNVPKTELAAADREAISKYTGTSAILNGALREGKMTPQLQQEADALNTALSKLPDYKGPVTRRTDLSEDILDRYRPGRSVTEEAFTSSSAAPSAAKDLPVEFQIVSDSGKYIGHHSGAPQELEVLFKSGTEFMVTNRTEVGGRIIIQMAEIPK
ncbi:ADP-ribosyltransferase [Nocardia sp. NPDC050710]|uniref:ADP-ribosyltransferase n=1 Tax=Nocardia sp. NPDC050710 TaxID=3157220 RepID=UPI0033C08DD8